MNAHMRTTVWYLGIAWALGTISPVQAHASLDPLACTASTSAPRPQTDGPQAVLIVLLSPRMPYALQEWPRMASQARRLGFSVHAYRDPRVPEAEWQEAVHALQRRDLACTPALELADALQLKLLHHAPSSAVAWCDRWHDWPILGVMPDASWPQLLNHRLEQLKLQDCT